LDTTKRGCAVIVLQASKLNASSVMAMLRQVLRKI
jgi:hypothetical protein